MRRVSRRPIPAELTDTIFSDEAGPWEILLVKRGYNQYRVALEHLRPKDRDLVVARMEGQWAIDEIRRSFGFGTTAAARMAVTRALRRLITLLGGETPPRN